MSDIIHLLPDSVANQIAAGEVIQRPASVVKELVENAVDAGANEIDVVIKDAGRTLIQVVDSGCGMSETDARLAFERHATSKIKTAEDLFAIRTKGFRGEALASIAAISQVILKTRQPVDEVGTEISINGSELEYQKAVSCPQGSNFQVKNLFYNVPARRKFLKSNSTELKHIITEFQRIALAHPEVAFNLIHNESDVYRLPQGNIRMRIIHIFGKAINSNLNNLETETSIVKIKGFVGKPEQARKTSGEQFLFINKRYMRHPYFYRAVMRAYEKLIMAETYPSFFLYFDADPGTIDINIHPTKTEIKFENEQAIFQIIQAAVKEALGKASAVPSIDFETEGVIDIPVLGKHTEIRTPEIKPDESYDPFIENDKERATQYRRKIDYVPEGWEQLYTGGSSSEQLEADSHSTLFGSIEGNISDIPKPEYLQLRNKYIITPVRSGLMIIDQKLAHERILFEQFIQSVAHNHSLAQRELYPARIDLEPGDYLIVQEIKEELFNLGIDIGDLGSNTVVINSCPAGLDYTTLQDLLEMLIEEYKETKQKVKGSATMTLAATLAKAGAIDYGKKLQHQEMQRLVDELFACENPNYSPGGKKIITIHAMEDIDRLFSG
jgi:DNA mismatch repair protein MutL